MKKIFGSIIFVVLFFTLFSVTVAAETIDEPIVKSFFLNQDPDPAKAGDVVEARLRFQNTGGAEARNIQVEFTQEYPFTLLTGEEKIQIIKSLPNWPEEENSKTVTFKLRVDREAVEGQYKIKFKYSTDEGNTWVLNDFNIEVTTKEFVEIIYIDKTKLVPGKETEMTFTINNIGNAPLQNLIFSWKEPNNIVLPVGTDNTRYIKYLGSGESVPLKYKVIADSRVDAGLYELSLSLEYDIKNNSGSSTKETTSTTAGVFIGGETDFDVAFSESSNGQTSFTVANIGSNPASSISVIIPIQKAWRVSGANSAVVGNLNKGDYTVASFNLLPGTYAMDTKTSSKNVLVQIAYTDTMGERHVVEKDVQSNSQTISAATGQTESQTEMMARMHPTQQSIWKNPKIIGPIITLIIIIGGIILYYKYKKKKRI